MEEVDTPLQKALREYMATSGRSAREISLAVGPNDSLVKAILSGKSKHPRADTVAKLATEIGRPANSLMPTQDDQHHNGAADTLPQGVDISDPMPVDSNARRDLPVYASAEGGPSGAMIISAEPVDWVKRPEPLLHVKDAFACYVLNDSMSPAYEHGDLLLVNPSKPVRGNDDCLFVKAHLDGSRDALVKRLVRPQPEKWRVRQFNPAKDFDLPRADWRQVMKIVGKYRD